MDRLAFLILAVFGVLLCAFGLFLVRLGRLVQTVDRQLASEGVDAEAQVTDCRVIPGRGSHQSYAIAFEYTVTAVGAKPGKYTQDTEVSQADFERLKPGATVAIRYLPSAPKEVLLQGGIQEPALPNFRTRGLAAIVIGVIVIAIVITAWLR